ncbi:MAG: hypothetical protein V1876_03150 [Candidatus Peregrinibacteria bacterium]
MSTTVSENQVIHGEAESALGRLESEVDEMTRLAEQEHHHFESAHHFAGFFEDPFVQKLVKEHGRAAVLTAMRDAKARGYSFTRAVSRLGTHRSSEPIVWADLFYEKLSSEDFDHYIPLLRDSGGAGEELEQQASSSIFLRRREALTTLQKIDTAIAAIHKSAAAVTKRSLREANEKQLEAFLARVQKAREAFQKYLFLSTDPTTNPKQHGNGRNGNGHHGNNHHDTHSAGNITLPAAI